MTMLLEYTYEATETEFFPMYGELYTKQEPSYEQVEHFVDVVKPRLQWQEHLGYMATHHSNIVLGVE